MYGGPYEKGAMKKRGDGMKDGIKKIRDRIYAFTDIMKTDILFRYNFIKAVLIISLIVFVVFLLGGNTGSSRSAEEIAESVVPHLMQTQQSGTEEAPDGQEQETAGAAEGGQDGQTEEDAENGGDTGVFDGMGQATALDFKRIFGLNAEDYEGVEYFKPISQMDVEELLIVRLASDDQAEALEEAVEERVDSQKTSFDGYGAAQCALLEKAIVKTRGNFLFYCVSPDAEQYYQAFLDAM